MNYAESLAYIESLAPTILNPDLARFAAFMKLHGDVQNSFRSFHVAGTNGKGSTVAIVDSVLRHSGFKVGRFTGPHLLKFNERFHLNGKPIEDQQFALLASKVRHSSEQFGRQFPEHGALTWFEVLAAMVFFYFYESDVDFAVLEVGLGGRFDATNVVGNVLVSAITTIDYDHMHILGTTLSQIAGEKAGIIKHRVPVVTGTTGEALQTILARAADHAADVVRCQAPNVVVGSGCVDTLLFDKVASSLALAGSYQRLNALLAFTMIEIAANVSGLSLGCGLTEGFENVYWPGRFQYLPEMSMILDGAHNVAGARALRQALDDNFPDRPRTFVFASYQNKNVEDSLKNLLRPQDRVVAAQCRSTRAVASAFDIMKLCGGLGVHAVTAQSVSEALQLASEERRANDLIVATGSFATVRESMLALGWRSVEDGIKWTYGFGRESCKIQT